MTARRNALPLALLALSIAIAPACGDDSPEQAGSDAMPAPNGAGSQSGGATASGHDSGGGFPDEARARGLDYENHSGEPAKATILEANGAGVAVLDLGEDGDLDIVFAQGLASLRAAVDGPGADLEVFENDGRGHFARSAGPGLDGWWTGLATGDVDGDGDTDLVAAGYGALELLLQDATGRLARAPASDLMALLAPEAGARIGPGAPREGPAPPWWFTSIALFDADRDGNLDLFAGRYLELDPLAPPLGELGEGVLAVPCRWKGYPVFCGPRGMKPQTDRLLRGAGDGTFADATKSSFAGEVLGFTLGVAPFDADGDGDTDLFVAKDSSANQLWINDGRGRFSDFGYASGVALSHDGLAQAGMGVAVGDVNRDGLFDCAVTNFSGESTELYFGAKLGFSRQTFRFGLQRATRELLSWGVHLVDLDGDGWLELFTANGHVYPQADLEGTGTHYAQRAMLWHLGPALGVEEVTTKDESSILFPALGSRGSAIGDFDLDGAPDLVLARIDGPAALGMNRSGPRAHRLVVRCLGPLRGESVPGAAAGRTPADGKGVRVLVVPTIEDERDGEPYALLSEAQTAAGYQSASSPWLHFGLGPSTQYSTLRIAWPSGRVEDLGPGATDRRLTVREGRGIVRVEELR